MVSAKAVAGDTAKPSIAFPMAAGMTPAGGPGATSAAGVARAPRREDALRIRQSRVVLAAAHLDHNPTNNRIGNLRSLCQRCHLLHDRQYHAERRRIT